MSSVSPLYLYLPKNAILGDPSALLDHLLDSYDKRVRPFADIDRPVIIEMTIVLGILTEIVSLRFV